MSSKENLAAAFAGESQANRRYLFAAEKADEAGQKQIARLFRAAAEAETVHARNHLGVLGEIKSTGENLKAAIKGESYEFNEMYPAFLEEAGAEGDKAAERSFDLANKVEKVHHNLFREALSNLESGKNAAEKPFFVCQVCGFTVEGEAPERCPVCGAPLGKFKQVD